MLSDDLFCKNFPPSLPASLQVALVVICLSTQEMQEVQGGFPDQVDPPEEGMPTGSNIFAWKIPLTEEPGRLQSVGPQRVGHH